MGERVAGKGRESEGPGGAETRARGRETCDHRAAMRCMNCNTADLVPARFTVSLASADGVEVGRDVDGFECPNCADRALVGSDAEAMSARSPKRGEAVRR